jgi:hypothetical protein
MTKLTAPGLEAFAVTAAGPLVTVADRSWPRDGSRVWELASASGECFYLKQHQSQRFHEREVTAYRLWAPALGTGRAPRLLAADPGLRAVLLTAGAARPGRPRPAHPRNAAAPPQQCPRISSGTPAAGRWP